LDKSRRCLTSVRMVMLRILTWTETTAWDSATTPIKQMEVTWRTTFRNSEEKEMERKKYCAPIASRDLRKRLA